ncbi:hypothetical protein FA15DRAFT_672745 [Coprinopsis marcescibilis]|uniref:F-box domain-containing protein n=1 Tax=Coprinopsis marcescibilis TaxID=230819 RepID=A0A5C3KLU4_COPMA|nr:hypothetical protein FA15DRAFT_672745 [Coprinopsis marcescibilis]
MATPGPVIPLTFDRVNQGHTVSSTAPLFSIPVELLHNVLQLFAPSDLAALAQVDHDCRQLARSAQFADVILDYSKGSSWQLLHLLENEVESDQPHIEENNRQEHSVPSPTNGLTRRIGSCIRRLSVLVEWPFPNPRPRDGISPSQFLCASKSKGDEGEFLSRGARIIQHLDHVFTVSWVTPNIWFTQKFAESLRNSCSLKGMVLDVAGCLSIEDVLNEWPLDSLTLRAQDDGGFNLSSTQSQRVPLLSSLSTSIRHLSLTRPGIGPSFPLPTSVLSMENLESLALQGFELPLHIPQDGFQFGCRMTHLSLSGLSSSSETISSLTLFFPRLQVLRWTRPIPNGDQIDSELDLLAFLRSHSGTLETLEFTQPIGPQFISDQLLPLLQSDFDYLKSLKLIWSSSEITPDVFQQLGTLNSLQHLWISAGAQIGQNPTWLIDHAAIFQALLPGSAHLPPYKQGGRQNLRTLIVTRDTYASTSSTHPLLDPSRHNHTSYYTSRILPFHINPDLFLTPAERRSKDEEHNAALSRSALELNYEELVRNERKRNDAVWERWHASRMKGAVEGYFRGLDGLRGCYVGGLLFERGGRNDAFTMVRSIDGDLDAEMYWRREACASSWPM